MTRTPRATVDFETRSACSLKAAGPWAYSIHPSTDILCLVWRLPYWEEGRTALWHPAFLACEVEERWDWEDIEELVQWIENGGLVEAHNVWFERCIWRNILSSRYGWPSVPLAQWRCSAAKASAHALPRGLDDAASALHLKVRKDADGHKVMMRVSKPRKALKKEKETAAKAGISLPDILWHEKTAEFEKLFAYCRQDVLVEEAVSHAMDDLSPSETQMFLMDGAINERGFQLDQGAVESALTLIASESVLLNKELSVVTNGYVDKATQRNNMKVWLDSEGLTLDDTQAATLDAVLLRSNLAPHVRRAVELMRALGRSSTAKYQAMANWAGVDWRVRGGLLYHGASTGRWSGAGVQPHNFPKGTAKKVGQKDGTPEDIDILWKAIKEGDRDYIIANYTGIMEALSNGLRGAIVAGPGKTLFVADFASIEARVLLWLAGDDDALNIFRNHEDIYCDMAAAIYGRPVTKADAKERGIGKIAILGLGYQMGASKFVDTCAKGGVTIIEDFYCDVCGHPDGRAHEKERHPFTTEDDPDQMTAVKVVTAYRAKYWRVKQCWTDQEAAAIAAVVYRKPVKCGPVVWHYRDIPGRLPILFCTLPSGRRLSYVEPRVKSTLMPWDKYKDVLSYMSVNPLTRQWTRQAVYGGLTVENIVQAIARDLMAYGMQQTEASGIYQLVLTVHDEMIAEAEDGKGDVKKFEALMATIPDWAEGCPVEAEGWAGKRYRK